MLNRNEIYKLCKFLSISVQLLNRNDLQGPQNFGLKYFYCKWNLLLLLIWDINIFVILLPHYLFIDV